MSSVHNTYGHALIDSFAFILVSWITDTGGGVDTLFEILDVDGDGVIDYNEFLNIALSTVRRSLVCL
mgnify:CR=1 FL=1